MIIVNAMPINLSSPEKEQLKQLSHIPVSGKLLFKGLLNKISHICFNDFISYHFHKLLQLVFSFFISLSIPSLISVPVSCQCFILFYPQDELLALMFIEVLSASLPIISWQFEQTTELKGAGEDRLTPIPRDASML